MISIAYIFFEGANIVITIHWSRSIYFIISHDVFRKVYKKLYISLFNFVTYLLLFTSFNLFTFYRLILSLLLRNVTGAQLFTSKHCQLILIVISKIINGRLVKVDQQKVLKQVHGCSSQGPRNMSAERKMIIIPTIWNFGKLMSKKMWSKIKVFLPKKNNSVVSNIHVITIIPTPNTAGKL